METDDKNTCPLTPCEARRLLENQDKLIEKMAVIEKYLFAGRVAMSVIVGIALSFDWLRDHALMLKAWLKED